MDHPYAHKQTINPTWPRVELPPSVSGASGREAPPSAALPHRLVSAMCSAVLFVIVTFFVFGVAFGLIAFAVVSFCIFSLAFGVGSFSGCGGFVASVFIFAV